MIHSPEIICIGQAVVDCITRGVEGDPLGLGKTRAESITLKAFEGYEYSMDGENWQSNNLFAGLTANTEYRFFQRITGYSVRSCSGRLPHRGRRELLPERQHLLEVVHQ